MQVGKGSAMKHYNALYNSLMHARPTMHCIPLVYLFIYIYGTCVFRIYIHPAPFVRDAIFPYCMTRLAEQKG